MGTWGPGILQDDVAVDTAIGFKEALDEGLTVSAATRRVLDDFGEQLDDDDDGPVIYLALALLQLRHGALAPEVRDKALEVIASGVGLGRWQDAVDDGWQDAPARLAARSALLVRFRAMLERGSCTPEELLEVADPEPHGGPWTARSYL